jgi:hypothetical protein
MATLSRRLAGLTERVLLALALALAIAAHQAASAPASGGGLIVIPSPASGAATSYFKLSLQRGRGARAGTIGLHNRSTRALRVALSAVDGLTLDTLGSAYRPSGSGAHGVTRWLRVAKPTVGLAAGASAQVPVSVVVPRGTPAGDYLAGVSVEALGQKAETATHGVSIASAVRYAIGVEVTVAGARSPAIRFTGAQLRRQPAGLTFLLEATNSGNVILQGAQGSALIRNGRRVVARAPLGPGTFVTGTSIAYPVPAFGEHPAEGTRYRITAVLRYRGGIARLDTSIVFGHPQALIQQQYATPQRGHRGTAWWKIALLAAAIVYSLTTTVLLLRRRSRAANSPPGATQPAAQPGSNPPQR